MTTRLKKHFIPAFILLSILSGNAFAGIKTYIQDIKVVGNYVYVTSHGRMSKLPDCVPKDNTHIWVLSLETLAGQSMHLSLLAAASKNVQVNIESTGDCRFIPNFEAIKSISIENS